MFRAFPEILDTLRMLLPPWAFALVVVVLIAAVLPAWLHWVRTRQIRGALRRMLRTEDPARRAAFRARAFSLAEGRPRRLVALTDEAIKLNAPGVWRESLAMLEATGKYPKDVHRIRAQLFPEPKRGSHPLEEAVIIERMWDGGLHDAALERLAEVRRRFPQDRDLAELAEKLERSEPSTG